MVWACVYAASMAAIENSTVCKGMGSSAAIAPDTVSTGIWVPERRIGLAMATATATRTRKAAPANTATKTTAAKATPAKTASTRKPAAVKAAPTTARKAPAVKPTVTTWDVDAHLEESAAPMIRKLASQGHNTRISKTERTYATDQANLLEHGELRWAQATKDGASWVKGTWFLAVTTPEHNAWHLYDVNGNRVDSVAKKASGFTYYVD